MMGFPTILVALNFIAGATLQTTASSIPRNPASSNSSCSQPALRLHLPDAPYDNYFYSDCHSSSHVIVSSPQPGNNLTIVKPRLIVAWPSGNSGALALFGPENGKDGSLSIRLEKTGSGESLDPINDSGRVGVSGAINFNDTARLTVPILGSIRTIRDFTEGGNTTQDFQGGFGFSLHEDGGATINRTWFDGVTTMWLTFTPLNGAKAVSFPSPGGSFLQ